jgi:hypothetical protein
MLPERAVGPARHRGRVGRLLDEGGDEAVGVDRHHAEGRGLLARHLEAARPSRPCRCARGRPTMIE